MLDRHGRPLMPCHPARARRLLAIGRAAVAHPTPFVIRRKDRTAASSEVAGVEVGIDPGGRATGISVFQTTLPGRVGLVSIEVQHRGQAIQEKIVQWAPVVAIHQELGSFDLQKMQNPEISGVEHQHGTLAGFETREYLLAKFDRTCGSFNVRTKDGCAQGISHRYCTILQRADGWGWSQQSEGVANAVQQPA